MKKYLCLALCVLFLFSLCACSEKASEPKTQNANSEIYSQEDTTSAISETKNINSAIYSQEDITSAIEVIEKEFKAEWSGCTLTEIYYAGDSVSLNYQDWADRHNADEVIVLLSSFDTDSSGVLASLNPNHTYNNWNWILVRTNDGEWQHVDHGY